MHPTIAKGLDKLAAASRQTDFRFFPFIKQLTLDVATSTFAGMELGNDADRLNTAFIDSVEASLAWVRWAVPGGKMWRGVHGRRELERAYTAALAQKRAVATSDLFSRLCHARSEDGAAFTDQEIINHMIFVMMAAHDTSTSTLTTMTYLLAKHPDWQERLRLKALAYDSDELRYDDLETQEELNWVIKETLRLYPPLTSIPRKTVRDIELGASAFPKIHWSASFRSSITGSRRSGATATPSSPIGLAPNAVKTRRTAMPGRRLAPARTPVSVSTSASWRSGRSCTACYGTIGGQFPQGTACPNSSYRLSSRKMG
jgi:hypothetical protein